jgi:hypothetical protein
MKSDEEIYQLFHTSVWNGYDYKSDYPSKMPLLAHYTSLNTLEAIVKNSEIWFSNPLYMNDLQELSFGINVGANILRESQAVKDACGTDERYQAFMQNFDHYYNEFSNKDYLDTYVLCFSEFDSQKQDGLLSMWRGYGGNGGGVAIVFDTAQFGPADGISPIKLAKVEYATVEKRVEGIRSLIGDFASLLASSGIADEKLNLPAGVLFERLQSLAVFTKHHGFEEEREWRAVYIRRDDEEEKIVDMLDYNIGSRGIEPKLKLKIRPIADMTDETFTLENIIERIILGPSLSNSLVVESIKRMLEKNSSPALVSKLCVSSTPYRAV